MSLNIKRINIKGSDRDSRILRYLDFSRLIALLEKKALHFSTISTFEDKHDGMFNCLSDDDHYTITNKGRMVRVESSSLDPDSVEKSASYKQFMTLYHSIWLNATGVSCWRIDQHESHAMWRVFLNSDEGIAIESTVSRLMKSVAHQGYQFAIGKVRYIDYSKDKIPLDEILNAFFYKNKYFVHEKELRLICYKPDGTIPVGSVRIPNLRRLPIGGVQLPVNLQTLITGIHISPYASEWFGSLVEAMIRDRYGLDVPIKPSGIVLRRT